MRKKEVLIVLFMVIGIILSFSLINLTKIQTITTSIVYSTPEKITISLLDEENNIISQIAPETEERTNISFEHQGNNIEFISLEPKTLNIKFFTKSDKDFIKTNIVAISWNPDFEKARVTLKKITNEKISVIYKCKTFDFNKGKCKSEWMPTNIEFEQTADKITFEVSSFSAYAGGTISYGVKQVTCECNSCDDCEEKLNNNSCDIVQLTADISSSGTCIDNPINFSNKTFDCQGYSITGSGSGTGIFLSSNNHNVTIQNCIISNFNVGIEAYDYSSYHTFRNLIVLNNDYKGIYLFGNNENISIESIKVINNSYNGIHIESGKNIVLKNITSRGSNIIGNIEILKGVNITVINSTANEGRYGVSLGSVFNSTFLNISVKNNTCDFYFSPSSPGGCSNNISNVRGTGDLEIKYISNSAINIQDKKYAELILCNASNSEIKNVTLLKIMLVMFSKKINVTKVNVSNGFKVLELNNVHNSSFKEIFGEKNFKGIRILSSNNNIFENVYLKENEFGIGTGGSSAQNNLSNITIRSSKRFGINLVLAHNNNFRDVYLLSNNQTGLRVVGAQNNTFKNIIITNSTNQNFAWITAKSYMYDSYVNFTNLTVGIQQNVGNMRYSYLNISSASGTVALNTSNFHPNRYFVSLNVSDQGAKQFNKTANITIDTEGCNNIKFYYAPQVYASREDIISNGIQSTPSYFTCSGGITTFSADFEWSSYTATVKCFCSDCVECESKLNDPNCDIVQLTQDISSNGTCIDDPADFSNKTFDCQGHSIIGNGTGVGIYLSDKINNTVSNCVIYNFSDGIYLRYSKSVTLANITCYDNAFYGIYLRGSNSTTLANITSYNNSRDGIYLHSSDSNTLTNIICYDNSWRGIYLYTSSNNNNFTNIKTHNNDNLEISIKNNAVNNTFKNIQIASYPTNISFIYDSGSFTGSIEIDGIDSPPPDPSDWHNISKYVEIINNNGPAWLWLNISYSDSDITGFDESTLKILKWNGSEWLESGWNGSRVLNTSSNIVGVNITSFSVFAPFGQTSSTCYCENCSDCQDKLNDSNCKIVKLTQNIINHSGTCIDNPSNFTGKTFDCQGHVIDGQGSGSGIYSTKDDNTIKNCIIEEFENGIYFFRNKNNQIINVTANLNERGIYLYGADYNNLTNITAKSNTDSGISVSYYPGWGFYDEAFDNKIENSTILNNRNYGISASFYYSGTRISLYNNTVCMNGKDISVSASATKDGINNTCTSGNWDDNGMSGCTYKCGIITECNCSSCSECYDKLNDVCSIVYLIKDINVSGSCIDSPDYWNGKIFDCLGNSINGSGSDYGINLGYRSYDVVQNCTLRKFQQGLRIELGGEYNKIINSAFLNCTDYGIYLKGKNNRFENLIIKENDKVDLYIDYQTSSCANLFQNITGSGNRPIKYFNSTVNLQDELLSELILCNADGSTISNVTVTGSDLNQNNGIFLLKTNNITLSNVNSSGNYYGLYLYYSSNNSLNGIIVNNNSQVGAYLDNSDNNNLTDCTASFNLGRGIYLYYSDNNRIDNCTVNKNQVGGGIRLQNSNYNKITNCTLDSNNNCGLELNPYCYNNLVQGCKITNTSGRGVYLYRSTDNNFTNTISNNNSDRGFYIDASYTSSKSNSFKNCIANNNFYGFYFVYSQNVTMENCTAKFNQNDGLYLSTYGGYGGHKISGGTYSQNNRHGINLPNNWQSSRISNVKTIANAQKDISSDCTEMEFDNVSVGQVYPTKLSFICSGTVQIKGVESPPIDPLGYQNINKYFEASATWLFINVSYNDSDITGIDESSLKIWKYDTTWLESGWNGTRILDTANNVVGVNITSFSVFAPLGNWTGICYCNNCFECTAMLNNSDCVVVKLTQDIIDNNGTCINDPTNFNNKIFDCQGYKIDGNASLLNPGYGIYFSGAVNPKSSNTIKNCKISDFEIGISFADSSGNSIFNNSFTNNLRRGIEILSGSNNNITNNIIKGGLEGGIFLENVDHTIINNNSIENSSSEGIFLFDSGYNSICNNFVNNHDAEGLFLEGRSSENNNLTNNVITNNGIGISFSGPGLGNKIINNTIGSNDEAIYAEGMPDCEFINNTLNSNDYGIRLVLNSVINKFLSNTIRNSTYYDIFIGADSFANTFSNTKIDNASISFVYASGSFSGNISIQSIKNPPADPFGYHNISKYVSITNNNGPSWLWLNISYSDSDISGIDESSLKIWKYNGTTWLESGWNGSRILDTANNVVGVNITSFSVFAPLGQMLNCNCSSCSECQDKLNNPGCDIVRLTTDISSNGTCIDDPADFSNKTFDCQGHTIIGNGTGIAIYIDSKEHNNITNCNITNFEYGIYLDKSTYNHLENITITSCSDKSIYLFHSPGNEFKNVYAEGNSSTGLYIRNVISGGLTWISAYTPGSDTDSENNTFYNLTLKNFDDYIIYNTNISNPNRFFNLTIEGNESGKLHWNSLSLTDANLSENNLIVQNDFISIKDTVSENQEFLTDAKLTLNAGDCTNLHFYKLSGFPQTRSEIISSGTLFTPTAYSCSDGIVEFTTVLGTGYAVRSVPTAEEETAGLPVRRKRRGCFEKWNCTDWGPCINGTQTRICYDIGSCKRPPRTESRPCVVQPKPAPPAPKPELKIKKEKPLPPAKPCKPPIVVLILIAGMFAHLAYCSIKLRQAPTEKEKRDFFDYIFGDALAIVALIVLAYTLCPASLENIVILTIASLAAIASIIWAFRHEAYELFTKRLKAERRLITAPEKKLRKRLEKERMLAEIERKKLAKARKTIAKALKRKLVHEEETIKKPEAALRKQLLEKIVPPTPTEIAKHKLELKQRLTREERALLKPEKELLKKVEKEKLALEKERKKRVKEIEHELKEKLLSEAAAITEPEKRLHKLLALEKARRAKALKKALEERKKELERIKRREAYEKRKRMLEEKVKREAELRKKLEEKAREISHTLNKFILKAMEQGLNKPKIKTLLINAGWNAKFIEKYVDKFYKLNAGLILRLRRMRHEQIEKGIFQLIDEIKEELKHPSIEKHYPVKISKKKKKEIIKTKKAPKINRHKADEKSSILIEKINKLIDHIDEELEKLKKF